MWGNKFFVQIMHIINTSAKGGALYESDVFENPQKAQEDWAKPDAMIEVKTGALSRQGGAAVQERAMKNYPQGLDRIMEFTFNNLPQASGINLEMLGLVEREQAGVLEAQRKKAGYAILATFFDSLRRYRKSKGRLRLFYIQNYLSDGRLIRIKGKDNTQQYVPLVRQKDTATYDVIVDDAPMSPNQKEAVWGMIQQMMPLLAKLSIPPEIWPVILEYSPLPSGVSGKINEILAQKAQEPPPPDPEMMKVQAQTQLLGQKAQLDAKQGEQEIAAKREEHEMEMQQKELELRARMAQLQAELAAEREKNALQMEGMEQKLALERETARLQLATKRQEGAISLQGKKAELAMRKQAGAGEGKGQGGAGLGEVKQLIAGLSALHETLNAPVEVSRDAGGKLTASRKRKK
jgi:hypothetical protein